MPDRNSPHLMLPLWVLPLLPVSVYAFSYIYLAAYHGQAALWNIVVHESGRLTFYETLFYSSHFIAHIPVHIVLALFFVGSFLGFANRAREQTRAWRHLLGAIGLFLLTCLAHSLLTFGMEDTMDYILQRKQGTDRFGEGGSWKLHYPSMMILPLLIPTYIWAVRRLLGLPTNSGRFAWRFPITAIVGFVLFAGLFETDPLNEIAHAWSNPRYLGHSVREIATFTLTYFPLLLWLMIKKEQPVPGPYPADARLPTPAIVAFTVFMILFAYQVAVSLRADIGSIAQKPDFAVGGELTVPYLLASHYFEHFLDTLFFALSGLLFFCIPTTKG
jgi:hypothetical protein